MNENKGLSAANVAVMYIGAIMGAGFASGRETWQFFGVFGGKGMFGVLVFALVFMIVGFIVSYNAKTLNTHDMGTVIVPGNNAKLQNFVGYFMAATLAVVMVAMSSAAGALIHQQFGLPYWVGGIIMTVLVIATVLGDFERISKVFRYVMPVLCIIMITACVVVIVKYPKVDVSETVLETSPIASNWLVAALLYTAYNVMAMVAIVASATINAKDKKAVIAGDTIGGAFLGVLAFLILTTVQKNGLMSQSLDMPVLGYTSEVSGWLGLIYTIVLFCAIYSTATSNFYGFTTKLKPGKHKNKLIIFAGLLSFVLGLIGFKNIVKYASPIMGYAGIVIITLLAINCIMLHKKEKEI